MNANFKFSIIVFLILIAFKGFSDINPNLKTTIRAESKTNNDYGKKAFIAFCQDFAPAYINLLQENYSGPKNWISYENDVKIEKKFDESNKTDLINEFGTVIHESTHHRNNHNNIFVSPGIDIFISNEEQSIIPDFFKSENIHNYLPTDAEQKLFRFKNYIGTSSEVSANLNGLWGLIDEYSAYQNGTRADLMAYENALALMDTTTAICFYKSALSTYYAYFEFRSFIGAYLSFARDHHPNLYNRIMNFSNLKKAFALNSLFYEESIDKIYGAKKNLKRQYSKVDWYLNYNIENHENYAKDCMNNFNQILSLFESPFKTESKNNLSYKKNSSNETIIKKQTNTLENQNSTHTSNIKRNSKLGLDFANVFWKKEYTLFDLTSDEPIFPINKNGIVVYQIYYCSNEQKNPVFGEFTAEQLEKLLKYKFKDKTNCIKFFNKN